jgi:hypothetical protein
MFSIRKRHLKSSQLHYRAIRPSGIFVTIPRRIHRLTPDNKCGFACLEKLILQAISMSGCVSIPPRKNICISLFQKLWFLACIPPRQEGRIAIVTTRGVGCGGRIDVAA